MEPKSNWGWTSHSAILGGHLNQYRYRLTRRLLPGENSAVCWIMLNPSTADALEDDPTIRRVVGFSKLWGYNRVEVVNLFAYRATDPSLLARAHYPQGLENTRHIQDAIRESDQVIFAWGGSGRFAGVVRLDAAKRAVAHAMGGTPRLCLGQTMKCEPRHPLYLKKTTEPIPFTGKL